MRQKIAKWPTQIEHYFINCKQTKHSNQKTSDQIKNKQTNKRSDLMPLTRETLRILRYKQVQSKRMRKGIPCKQ